MLDFAMDKDQKIWEARPSQILNIITYILLFWTIIPPLIVYLKTRFTIYQLDEDRLIEKTGVLSQKIQEIELYRVRDYTVEKPFIMRLFGLGNLILVTSDKTNPKIYLYAIRNVESVRDVFRKNVEATRKQTGTKEVDFT